MINSHVKYFLAANSAEGFVSHFKECYNPLDGWKVYIIKGGPGTGKSSFMKFIAKKAQEKNLVAQFFPCSSDPDSLDAVTFPQLKTVIMDGTAPHTVDPDYAGVCESILNFGSYWDEKKLDGKADEIIRETGINKAFHRLASSYIKTGGRLIEENYKLALYNIDLKKISKFSDGLIKKYIPAQNGGGYEWQRFLSGITPKGVISYPDTVLSECSNTVIIRDEYGAASNELLKKIRIAALERGYEIITIKNPLLPSLLLDGVIIPKLSLGFAREYNFMEYNSPKRRIRAERFLVSDFYQKNRGTLKFNFNTATKLLSRASDTLSSAKLSHDRLEKYYIEAMDFESLKGFAEEFADKIFKKG